MKKKLINVILSVIILIILYIYINCDLYSKNICNSDNLISILSNEEKIININNKSNSKYIYNIYISNKKYQLNDMEIYIDNKLVNNSYIKNNNYIIFKFILNKKSNRLLSIKIKSSNKTKYKIHFNKIKYNERIIDYLKKKSSKNNYYIDTDGAKEVYKISDNYKYIGNIPNNFLYFNCLNQNLSSCELWRIIGIQKKNKEESLKIIKYSNENYNNSNYSIYENNKYLMKSSDISILSINDYIDSYKMVNNKCVKNIYNCNKKSYLTPKKNELIDNNGIITSVSNKGNIIKNKVHTNLYRPVIYLKKNIIVMGGEGSFERPYFLK